MIMKFKLILAAAAIAAACGTASAAEAPAEFGPASIAALPAGHADKGMDLHAKRMCAGCHGAQGVSTNPMFPHVSGQPVEVTEKALLEYRAGVRKGAPAAMMMIGAAKMLSDQDIADIAAAYAELPGPDGKTLKVGKKGYEASAGVPRLVTLGDRARAITPCSSCHGFTGVGSPTGKAPVLQGQIPSYLADQLKLYKSGKRDSDFYKEMRFFAQHLTDDEIKALAAYYGSETGRPGTVKAAPAAPAKDAKAAK
jgi:cytochrome c553